MTTCQIFRILFKRIKAHTWLLNIENTDLHSVLELRDTRYQSMAEKMTPQAPDPDCLAMRTVCCSEKECLEVKG